MTLEDNSKRIFQFTYNDEGIRTSKSSTGLHHSYNLDGTRIVSEKWSLYAIVYLYDESGSPIGMQYRTLSYAEGAFDTFYFEKNLQGDIIAVYNASGTKLVGYTYDAWGNCTTTYYNGGASTGAQYNPFRYRGYYYDTDFGLYYLNSRYYDPNTGRFINADKYISTGQGLLSHNLYAYCYNNPISYADYNGDFPWMPVIIIAGVVVVVAAAIIIPTAVNYIVNENNENNIEKDLKDSYTKEEAISKINEIAPDIKVNFEEDVVSISGSSTISKREDRQKISMIISRVEDPCTFREYGNISSEWLLHNIFYNLGIKRSNADPADLEYTQDNRWYVRLGTKVLEVLGWE